MLSVFSIKTELDLLVSDLPPGLDEYMPLPPKPTTVCLLSAVQVAKMWRKHSAPTEKPVTAPTSNKKHKPNPDQAIRIPDGECSPMAGLEVNIPECPVPSSWELG